MIAKRTSVFIFTGVILLAFSAAGAQTTEDIAVKVRVTAEQANIRELPDIGSAMLIQLPEGTVLDAEAREKDWYRVRFTRRDGSVGTGWIHGSLVRPLEPDALPSRKPPIEKRPDIPVKAPPRLVESKSRIGIAAGKTGLLLFGGGSVLAMGDWNASMKGLADYFGAASGARPSSDPGSLRLAYVLGFEFSFPLTDDLFLGLGADYFQARSSSEIFYRRAGTEDLLKIDPHVRALPIKAGLIFSPIPNFYAKGALQVIYAKAGYGYRFEEEEAWREWTGEASALGLGGEAAVGGEWTIFPGAVFVVETGYRRAKISGFKGSDTFIDSEGWTNTENGRLYVYQAALPGLEQEPFPLMFIRATRPAEAGISDARDAVVDLSGISLKIGLKILF
ncbi:MAG: SH3 domain-containing protein [Acidobacteriota bacterium]|nr:SH3 domain-containing protein [Acidobacteriota bacterium]